VACIFSINWPIRLNLSEKDQPCIISAYAKFATREPFIADCRHFRTHDVAGNEGLLRGCARQSCARREVHAVYGRVSKLAENLGSAQAQRFVFCNPGKVELESWRQIERTESRGYAYFRRIVIIEYG